VTTDNRDTTSKHNKEKILMKIISKLLILIIAVASLTACIGSDEGKMQGNKASDALTK
jgi:hypothetical protein